MPNSVLDEKVYSRLCNRTFVTKIEIIAYSVKEVELPLYCQVVCDLLKKYAKDEIISETHSDIDRYLQTVEHVFIRSYQ